MLMPQCIGGLGLWLPGDLAQCLDRLPNMVKDLIWELIHGCHNRKMLKDFSTFLSNKGFRGYASEDSQEERIWDFLTTTDEPVVLIGESSALPVKNWWTLNQLLNPNGSMTDYQTVTISKSLGWITENELIEKIARPILFNNILARKAKQTAFNTDRLDKRLAKLWNEYHTRYHYDLDMEMLVHFLSGKIDPKVLFYNTRERQNLVLPNGDIMESTLMDTINRNLPSLRLTDNYVVSTDLFAALDMDD